MIIEFTLTSPLSHGAFESGGGNAMPLRRFPCIINGEPSSVPAVSGNALRGRLRRLVFRDMFARLNLDSSTPGFARAYAIAANGGWLDSSDTTIDPDKIKRVRQACPPLSVFGAAMGSWFLEGRMSVGICWPVTRETASAGLVDADSAISLADIESETWLSRLPDRERSKHAGEELKPMPHGAETLAPGVALQSEIVFQPEATDTEIDSVRYGLSMLDSLGGKTASGHGRAIIKTDAADGSWSGALDNLDPDAVMEIFA